MKRTALALATLASALVGCTNQGSYGRGYGDPTHLQNGLSGFSSLFADQQRSAHDTSNHLQHVNTEYRLQKLENRYPW